VTDGDFNNLVSNALLAADDAPLGWFDLSAYFRSTNADFPLNTINDVRTRLAQLGFGKTYTDAEPPHGRYFKINTAGRSRAAEIRADRQAGLVDREKVTIQNNITVSPVFNNSNSQQPVDNAESIRLTRSGVRAGWFSAWIGWLALVVGAVAAYLAYLQFVKA
jgi:hypothetical protein